MAREFDLDVEIDGDEITAAEFALTFTLDGVRSLRKWLLGPATTISLSNIERQFYTEGRRFGRQWEGLAERTRRHRVERGYGEAHPILRQSEALFDMATTRGKGLTAVATEDTLHMSFQSSKVPYAEDHLIGQMVVGERFVTIPVRRWLPPNEGTPAMRKELEVSLAHELERRAAYNLRRRLRRVQGPS